MILFQAVAFGRQPKPAQANKQNEPGPQTDLCHVYVVDVEKSEKLLQELETLPKPTEAQLLALKEKYPDSEQILGEFEAEVGEEVLTSKSYPLIGTGQYVTVSVYYTDEMMASKGHSDSMSLGIVISPTKYDNAMGVENSAVAQLSYTADTDKVQVKTKKRINDKVFIVGLECQARVGTFHR